uniref:hypothetical protein n=1 Tax=Paenibacillus curdlanolyticus TaxID=59840 RepID=UPI0018F49605|nr:hypothetical protein [Paenibacillus curdlanolyticus]
MEAGGIRAAESHPGVGGLKAALKRTLRRAARSRRYRVERQCADLARFAHGSKAARRVVPRI